MKFLNIIINNKNVKVQENISILQACDKFKFTVPRFCYHPFLSIAGNCRMCLVQIENMPKLQVACAISVSENMIINTNSLLVLKSREGVLEFLLIYHPLDCAICDASSECDLQDQSMFYGSDKTKFKEFKRATEDKSCGPLIKTVMTRCIFCTRCVRFANEVLGLSSFGSIGRANSAEIGTFINKFIFSELSGNLIDLCPVGALTAKPYRFMARSWELNTVSSIDLFDSIHSNVRIDLRGYNILRILPRLNEYVNDIWISDKARFAFDGLKIQRLVKPCIKKNTNFKNIIWFDIINLVYDQFDKIVNFRKFGFFLGCFLDLESLVLIKYLANKLNALFLDEYENYNLSLDFENSFKFNYTLKDISFCDSCCLLGTNPIKEGVLINYHIRKRFIQENLLVSLFGSFANINVPYTHLGVTLSCIIDFIEGKHLFCKNFLRSKKPIIIFGKSFLNSLKFSQINIFMFFIRYNIVSKKKTNFINFLSTKTSDFSKYYLGLSSFKSIKILFYDLIYMFGNTNLNKLNSEFTIVQSHHGSNFIQKNSKMIMPTLSFLEKTSYYFNLEGRLQKANKATIALGQAYSDDKILFSFFYFLNLYNLKNHFCFIKNYLPLINIKNSFVKNLFFDIFSYQKSSVLYLSFLTSNSINNFYNSDIICNFSSNMIKCSKYILNKNSFKK